MIPLRPPPKTSEIKTQLLRSPIDVPIIDTLYKAYQYWHELLLKFPKSERYTLGQTCSTYLLGILENVLGAATNSNSKAKIDYLNTASIKLDTLRLLTRLAKDCQCFPNNAYLKLESKLHEAGRMLGGWIKSL